MRIVVLLGRYYPSYSANGRCAKNIVDVLLKEHDVTVISRRWSDSPSSSEEAGLEERLVFVNTAVDEMRARCEARGRAAKTSEPWHMIDRALACVNYGKTLIGRTPCHKSGVKAYRRGLEELGFVPDQLIPIALPFESVVACAEYKTLHPEVKLTPILFDQFAVSKTLCKTEIERKAKIELSLRLERKVFEACDRVFHVTWADHVGRCMPDLAGRFERIEHPLLVKPEYENFAPERDGRGVAVFAGSIDSMVRKPDHLLEVFAGLLDASPDLGLTLEVYAHGGGVVAVKEAARAFPDRIVYREPVPSDEIKRVYAGATLLVSIGNTVVNQKPSKTTEYFATGKPVVHVACRDDDPVIPEVEAYPLGIVLRERDGVQCNVEKLSAFCRESLGRCVSFAEVARRYADQMPEHIVSEMLGGGVMTFTGSFTLAVEPTYVCELLEQEACDGITALFHTNTSAQAKMLDGRRNVVRKSWVSGIELERVWANADCLLSIAEKQGRQMSSKIFSYMAIGKPIVHIYYAEYDVNVVYLKRYPLALCLRAKEGSLALNSRLLALWLVWSLGRTVSWDSVAEEFLEMSPEYVACRLIEETDCGT